MSDDPTRRPFEIVESFAVKGGHSYHKAADDSWANGAWGIADQSAGVPWLTDDGNWFVDETKPIRFYTSGMQIPLICLETKRTCLTPACPREGVMVASRLELPIIDEDEFRYRVVDLDKLAHLERALSAWFKP